jgi:ABC-2 type transport system ATP-binding protein
VDLHSSILRITKKIMLEVFDLVKDFNQLRAVDGVRFHVQPGSIFGLLGPNGAGKTTTLRLIMGILKPDSGEILLDGESRARIPRQRFGYIPEERGLYQQARVLELLVYFGILNHLSRHRAHVEAIRLLDKFSLTDYTMKKINELSKGMQQKIQLITAILHSPDVLIMDEPFAGLDPVNQIFFRELIAQYKNENKLILLSTHQMTDVEQLCDNICLINQGKIILDGKLETIKTRFREDSYYIEVADDLSIVHDIPHIDILEEHNRSCKIKLKNKNFDTAQLLQLLSVKTNLTKFIRVEPTLHDIFIKVVQNESGQK